MFNVSTLTVNTNEVDVCNNLLPDTDWMFEISTLSFVVFKAFAMPVLTVSVEFCNVDADIPKVMFCWTVPSVVILQVAPENGTFEQSHS